MRILVTGLVATAALVGGYVFWWNKVADTAEQQILAWKEQKIREGYQISHEPIVISDFPYRVKLNIASLEIKAPAPKQQSLKTGAVWAIAQPWNIKHIIFGTEEPVTARWLDNEEEKTLKAEVDKALGSVTFTHSGKLETLAIDITDLTATPSWRSEIKASRLQVHERASVVKEASSDNQEKQKPARQLAVRIDNLLTGTGNAVPLGEKIEHFGLSALLEGSWKQFTDQTAVEAWRDEGGALDIQELAVRWGQSKLSSSGTLSLDPENRPIGAFTAKITGYNTILATMADAGKFDRKSLKTAGFALNLLAKEDEQGERYLNVPLTLQEGGLYLGPIFLTKVSPIF